MSLISAMYMIGWSFGLVLLNVGGLGRSGGSWPVRLRDRRLHVRRGGVDALVQIELQREAACAPGVLLRVTSSSPGICMNCRSSGVATLFAIVSGVAPG